MAVEDGSFVVFLALVLVSNLVFYAQSSCCTFFPNFRKVSWQTGDGRLANAELNAVLDFVYICVVLISLSEVRFDCLSLSTRAE